MTANMIPRLCLLIALTSCNGELDSNQQDLRRCGNGVCGRHETCESCPDDCGTCAATCGDGTCGIGESCDSCSEDCGTCTASCGDGTCSADESCSSCAADCGTCGGGNLLFASGWENTSELGCTYTGLIDGVWEDYGGSTACAGTVHDADIVTDIHHDGARALRVTQKPGNQNGTDFRIVRTFGNQPEVTITGWVYYSPNYHWASADHKIFITMDAQSAQNVYINYRGGSDPQHARLCAGITPADTVYCASSPQVTVDTWYRIRAHIVAGVHGSVQIWLQPQGQLEVPLDLVYDAGSVIDLANVNTGALTSFKYDTTYNLGSSITELMYQYVDSIEVRSGL